MVNTGMYGPAANRQRWPAATFFQLCELMNICFGVCTLTHTVDTIDTVKKNDWVKGSQLAKTLVATGFG